MQNNIIIKRIAKKKQHAHGGMWKVAYADFITAMMVLFLLLWVISSVPEEKLSDLGNYFSPTIFKEKSGKNNSEQKSQNNKNIHKNSVLAQQFMSKLRNTGQAIHIAENSEEITITLESEAKKALFANKSSKLLPDLKKDIALIINEIKNTSYYISIVGYTNGMELSPNTNYSNWELSIDRANAVRRALIASGIDSQRIAEVIGRADVDPVDFNSPTSLHNRRIDIKLLKDKKQIGKNKKNTPGVFN